MTHAQDPWHLISATGMVWLILSYTQWAVRASRILTFRRAGQQVVWRKPNGSDRVSSDQSRPMENSLAITNQHRRRYRPTRAWHWLVALAGGVFLFYIIAGYLCIASLIGENPRWRGMNRGPGDFGLKGEVVSLRSTGRHFTQGMVAARRRQSTSQHHHRPRDRSHAPGNAASCQFSGAWRV